MATSSQSQSSPSTIEHLFEQFSKFGNTQSNGQTITLKNSDKWMKQANLFTKQFTTTDTGIVFAKFKVKQMDLPKFREYIEDLCKTKKLQSKLVWEKLLSAGSPGTTATTAVVDMNVTERLTDTSKYTGSHKERFDVGGSGKGIAGRENIANDDGYVQGFKRQTKK